MDSFITGGKAISSTAYSADYGVPHGFVDKAIKLEPVECGAEIGSEESRSKLHFYKKISIWGLITGIVGFFLVFVFAIVFDHPALPFIAFGICMIGFALFGVFMALCCSYFKEHLVEHSLSEHYPSFHYNRRSQSVTPNIFRSLVNEKMDPDWIQGAELRHLVKYLNLGGSEWNRGHVSDEILGYEGSVMFRFFDTSLEYVRRSGKSSTVIPIFRGQIYIFPAKITHSCDRLYLPLVRSAKQRPQMLSDFYSLFRSYPYSQDVDPFIKSHKRGLEVLKDIFGNNDEANRFEDEPFQHDTYIETREFIECLLMLYLLLPGVQWGVRIVNGYFVLIIMRNRDVFEYAYSTDLDDVIFGLRRDLSEMYSITHIVANYLSA